MDPTQKFVQAENIKRYADKICSELDPLERDALMRLLIEEEDKFALASWHHELAQNHIRNGQQRINNQRALVQRVQGDGRDATAANALLQNMIVSLELFTNYADRIARNLMAGPI